MKTFRLLTIFLIICCIFSLVGCEYIPSDKLVDNDKELLKDGYIKSWYNVSKSCFFKESCNSVTQK